MRAISQYAEYCIQIQPQRQQGLGDGSVKITQEPIYARFEKGAPIFENEIEQAEKRFAFSGRYQHLDEATNVDPLYRLSLLDTRKQGWDDSVREFVEAELRRKETITNDFFISEKMPISAPFPNWDTSEKPAFQLVNDLIDFGFDLNTALDYERAYGPGRPALIEALEETIKDRAAETIPA
jgi:hypothetical protein